MSDYDDAELAEFKWTQSRIPALDGLVTFIPDGQRDPAVDQFATSRSCRWYPVKGGTRVVILYEEPYPYDAARWHIEKGRGITSIASVRGKYSADDVVLGNRTRRAIRPAMRSLPCRGRIEPQMNAD